MLETLYQIPVHLNAVIPVVKQSDACPITRGGPKKGCICQQCMCILPHDQTKGKRGYIAAHYVYQPS